jgi:hypothetical protein
MKSKQISNNGIHLFSESFGSPDDTPILLIMGAMAEAIWWRKGLTEGNLQRMLTALTQCWSDLYDTFEGQGQRTSK